MGLVDWRDERRNEVPGARPMPTGANRSKYYSLRADPDELATQHTSHATLCLRRHFRPFRWRPLLRRAIDVRATAPLWI